MEGFTHVIIQIMNEESYLSVSEVETIIKVNYFFLMKNITSKSLIDLRNIHYFNEYDVSFQKLSDETASIDISLEKEPVLPAILQNLLKIVTSMEVYLSFLRNCHLKDRSICYNYST